MNKRKLSEEAGGRALQAEGTVYANWRQSFGVAGV